MKLNKSINTLAGHTIEIQQRRISVKSRQVKNGQYAFYLTHNNEIEKKFYSNENQFTFEKEIRDGVYLVSCFTRDANDKSSAEKTLLIVQNGAFVLKRIIADEQDYKIVLYDLKSDVTFIVFNGAGSTKEYRGFGLNYLLSKGYNVITCAQNNDQYQGLSFDEFKAAVGPLVAEKKVFLYGSSLGGYCALYFAGAVKGTVIAAAPKNSAHPKMIKNNKSKFSKNNFKHKDIVENQLTDKSVNVLVDPLIETDTYFINEFIKPAYPDCNILEFPYAGHEVLYHVNKLKKLSPLIMDIVENRELTLQDLDFDKDTEFTQYGKALNAYRTAVKYIAELKSNDSVHPVISKKLQWLENKIK